MKTNNYKDNKQTRTEFRVEVSRVARGGDEALRAVPTVELIGEPNVAKLRLAVKGFLASLPDHVTRGIGSNTVVVKPARRSKEEMTLDRTA